MQPDAATRILLALILLSLVILIVQGSTDRARSEAAGRYTVTGMRAGSPILVRTDTATGRVWKLDLRGAADSWQEFREPEARDASERPLDQSNQERPDPRRGDQS